MIRNWKTISDDTNTMFTSRREHTAQSYDNKYLTDEQSAANTSSPPSDASSDTDQVADDDYSARGQEIGDEMNNQRNSMSFGSPETVTLHNVEMTYVDKDNYDKYLNVKSKFTFASLLFFQMFWKIYGFLIIGFAIYELVKVFYDNVLDIDTKWGLLLTPYVLHTLFNSFNRYSTIKISV